ncbi:hypothetical protein KW803_01020 [Candidatus Saccharibacteria bacterium]|nr:hypothetical protein [Candidatus Saccharibacteria bacterium]
MEYMSRGDSPAGATGKKSRSKGVDWAARTVRLELFIVLVGSALLLAAVALFLGISNNAGTSQSKIVNNDQYQAVFLNGGATSGSVAYTTYFGHITKMTGSYVTLKDVYYLTTATTTDQSASSSPQLTKLGCQQLHSPTDQMVINMNQVAFWENLQNSGKVVQAIQQFQKQNPNGPNCTATNTSNTGASTQTPATTTPSTTNP